MCHYLLIISDDTSFTLKSLGLTFFLLTKSPILSSTLLSNTIEPNPVFVYSTFLALSKIHMKLLKSPFSVFILIVKTELFDLHMSLPPLSSLFEFPVSNYNSKDKISIT